MQEEINHKTITVYIRGAKVTAQTLKAALRAMLRARDESGRKLSIIAQNRFRKPIRDLKALLDSAFRSGI